MFDHEYKTERASGTCSHVPASESGHTSDRRMSFGCCSTRMGDAIADGPCGSIMRRHPVVMSVILALMGLAVLLIPTGAILVIIAFLRTI